MGGRHRAPGCSATIVAVLLFVVTLVAWLTA